MHPSRAVRCAHAFAWAMALLLVCVAGGARADGTAKDEPATVRIVVPEGLTPGTPALIEVYVRLPPGPEQPLLLTPSSEGEAVRVTRGRLLRADATRTDSGELRFQVPVAVIGTGTAVLHVALLTYRCTRRCNAVRAHASRTLQITAR